MREGTFFDSQGTWEAARSSKSSANSLIGDLDALRSATLFLLRSSSITALSALDSCDSACSTEPCAWGLKMPE
eukprot:CAMPEP_0173183658 /NCGR_PEP_ID=MMETSP1141-20130122/8517_1 /TAXON_ID=483371 /ORGANISM="non described non described, Strain CCMP2298" /LENGTH=72 /DNA_ID=CAMNT_0014106891 /DNA_START=175 /DNA_END=394 /DNA_ORIENTATION=-